MVVNFSEFKRGERPVLVLRNLSGDVLAPLGFANNVSLSLHYNEVSELTFELPAYADGEPTPDYDLVIGMRIADLQGIGRFILTDPSERDTGKTRVKTCKGYSLEYEFTFRKISMPRGTYEFYNEIGFEDSIIGRIKELMPRWRFEVDEKLIGRHRTFEVSGENLYNFIKNTLQTSYNCVFDFDTYTYTVHVREVDSETVTKSVYLSTQNLIKDLIINEDTEGIITCLDVNGAEGVNIRDVNPIGSNKLYNLDYFLNEQNFTPAQLEKWNSWKQACRLARDEFYRGWLECDIRRSEIDTEKARLEDMETQRKGKEQISSALQEWILAGKKEEDFPAKAEDYESATEPLEKIHEELSRLAGEINMQSALIGEKEDELKTAEESLYAAAAELKPSVYFTPEEWQQYSAYMKEDSLTESSFAMSTASSYAGHGTKGQYDGEYLLSEANVTKIPRQETGKTLYTVQGGVLAVPPELGSRFPAKVVNATLEVTDDGEVIFSALLNLPIEGAALGSEPEETGQEEQRMFRTAYLSLTGARFSAVQDDTVFPAEPKEPEDTPTEPLNAYAAGSWVRFSVEESFVYLTENASVYEQNSVAWSLYEYGEETLRKLAYPSYTFSVNAANFLVLEEFESFKDQLALGERIFLQLDEGKLLQPFVIGVDYSFSDPTSFSIRFSDKYCSFDAAFRLVDLLEQSVSMGKSVDFSKYTYRNFVDSGAQTEVQSFIQSALDVSKNAVLSSQNQAISWDESGLKLRKWKNDQNHAEGYEDDQIAMLNNNIVFTADGFQTVKMAIGRFKDETRGSCFGIVAPNIVGTLLAGENLRIQTKNEEGKPIAFQVDETGAKLHNAEFDITTNTEKGLRQIVLNPDVGIAMGIYPVYNESGFDKENARFYIDAESGDAYFNGVIQAEDYLDKNGKSMVKKLEDEDHYRFQPEYLNLKGLTIKDKSGTTTFQIDENGHVTMQGDITINNGAPDGTFISGTSIYAPTIESPTIKWYDDKGEFLGSVGQGSGKNDGSPTVLLEMKSTKGISLNAENGGISLIANNGGIWFSSRAGALKGLDVRESFRIATKCYTPSCSTDGWTDILAAFRDIERRLNKAESDIGGILARITILESQ